MEPSDENKRIIAQRSFEHELNRHGYGFQFRALKEARNSFSRESSKWRFLVSEFPVEVRGVGTRIDFILEGVTSHTNASHYMICECKRVNPALSRWCFIRAPYTRRKTSTDRLMVETVSVANGQMRASSGEGFHLSKGDVYHIGRPVKVDVIGDSQPTKSPKDEIEDAITQVLRGVNGYVNTFGANPQLLSRQTAFLIPAVITTAELWASDSDLSTADLITGRMDLASATFEQVDWLWLQYNTSPGIKHSLSPTERPDNIAALMGSEFMRTVAIVSPAGIEKFLNQTTAFLLE